MQQQSTHHHSPGKCVQVFQDDGKVFPQSALQQPWCHAAKYGDHQQNGRKCQLFQEQVDHHCSRAPPVKAVYMNSSILPNHQFYSQPRRQVALVRRMLIILIILIGLFTIAWSSTIRVSRETNLTRSHNTKKTKQQTSWQFTDEADYGHSANTIWPSLTHLIIVPGHAINTCQTYNELLSDKDCWYLLDHQNKQQLLFLEHIKKGLQLAELDSESLLMFSGGQTRSVVGPISEASSYYNSALLLGLEGAVRRRSFLEEYARDSFENIAFSLCRFKQVTGNFPRKVTVVGFPFKAARFRNLHWATIAKHIEGYVEFNYVGVIHDEIDQTKLYDDAYQHFKADPYGQHSFLSNKRHGRNPFKRQHPYSCFSWLK